MVSYRPFSGKAGLTCRLLIMCPANARSLSASGMLGSTSMNVLDVSANQVWCDTFRLGLDISSAVRDGCHSIGVVEATPHKDSIASLVSSITPTFTRSAVVPSFFVTVICQLCTASMRDSPITFFACTDTLHNNKNFGFRHLEATLGEILQRHESRLVI